MHSNIKTHINPFGDDENSSLEVEKKKNQRNVIYDEHKLNDKTMIASTLIMKSR